MDCSPPGSSVHGISQARILEWVATSFSRGSSWLRDQTHIPCIGRQILYHSSHQGSNNPAYTMLISSPNLCHADDPLTTILSSLPNQTLTVILNSFQFLKNSSYSSNSMSYMLFSRAKKRVGSHLTHPFFLNIPPSYLQVSVLSILNVKKTVLAQNWLYLFLLWWSVVPTLSSQNSRCSDALILFSEPSVRAHAVLSSL